METVHIIGHGQSPLGKGWGTRIDENIVIRLKLPDWQKPEDYGSRVDYMAASTEVMPSMLDYPKVPKEYWGMPKKGIWSSTTEANFRSRARAPLVIPLEHFLKWNGLFKFYDDQGVRNHSLGMFAITYACERLKPTEIRLVGFDNMLEPGRLDYFKANRGKWTTGHNWYAENRMIPDVEKEYGVKIVGFR